MKTIVLILCLIISFSARAQEKRVGVRTTDRDERRMVLLEQTVLDLEAQLTELRHKHDSLQQALKRRGGLSLDIGAGFQQFRNAPSVYYMDREGQVQSIRYGSEPQQTLSVLLNYHLKGHHHLALNLPLVSWSGKHAPGVGLFNQRFAMGIGYAHDWGRHKLFGTLNVQPYEQPDLEVLQERYRYLEPYTRLDLSDSPSYRRYNPGLSLGYSYQLWTQR